MEVLKFENGPKAVGPYSSAMRSGNLIFFLWDFASCSGDWRASNRRYFKSNAAGIEKSGCNAF